MERVLVVEDDAPGGATIGTVLAQAGFSVKVAASSREALAAFGDGSGVDVSLLACALANSEELPLLEMLKALRPETPIIVVSCINDLSVAVGCIKKGASDYLLKPVDKPRLVRAVRQAIDERTVDRRDALQLQGLERLVEARTEMLRRAIADLELSYDITLEALGNALDLKDAETEGHSKRVTAYSIVLARAMNIDPVEVKVIARGAFLHDIGKMAIPDAILSKPGKLTLEEQLIMREHCVLGYTILRKIPFLEQAAEIVFSHQEHYDGSGYSRGLKGLEIPLGARIFAIADALDAITSDRPYRKAQSFANARIEIERCSGTQFDPAIVAVFRQLPDQLWVDLRTEIDHPRGVASFALSEALRNR
jgi:putative nucleotidyltransferase with HDIG domain